MRNLCVTSFVLGSLIKILDEVFDTKIKIDDSVFFAIIGVTLLFMGIIYYYDLIFLIYIIVMFLICYAYDYYAYCNNETNFSMDNIFWHFAFIYTFMFGVILAIYKPNYTDIEFNQPFYFTIYAYFLSSFIIFYEAYYFKEECSDKKLKFRTFLVIALPIFIILFLLYKEYFNLFLLDAILLLAFIGFGYMATWVVFKLFINTPAAAPEAEAAAPTQRDITPL